MKRRTKKTPERDFQRQVATFLGVALPRDAFWTAIPGGDGRVTRAPGYRSGTPDLLIIWRGQTLLLELKSPKGVTSAAQTEAHRIIKCSGAQIEVCRSLTDIERAISAAFGASISARISA